MLLRLRYGRRGSGDTGLATSSLVMAMALLLAAGVLTFGRLAHASDLRLRAQTGADAAALGALAPLRDAAVGMVLGGNDPSGAGYWMTGTTVDAAAKPYAEENLTKVVKAGLSGMIGDYARVDVASKECQLKKERELTDKEKDDLRNKRNLCTDTSGKTGIGRVGTAHAVAKMIPPTCVITYKPYDPIPEGDEGAEVPGGVGEVESITCEADGRKVRAFPYGNRAAVTRLFKIRLVDKESPVSYTGMPDGGLFAGGGVVQNECAKTGDKPAEDLEFGAAVVAWALCWRGTPYRWGGGNYNGPSRGICCSPGGHDGSIGIGFDCSGLTLYAVYQASRGRIALGHYTGNQVADPRGTPVPLTALKAGDLLFFGAWPTHHVAIFYGDGQMVEAPQTGDVVKISQVAGRGLTFARRFG
ncbi:C40 family peptidase [Spirillospora sp. NPDC047279]|uniref:C40 family peptidase n=1 Tax=Spirillospora sp. NPDC047279 TaxID=3155478 RepID=UPI0033C2728F